MLQIINKKTSEVFEVIVITQKGAFLKSLDTGKVKKTAGSTLKRWYTKPYEVYAITHKNTTTNKKVVTTQSTTTTQNTITNDLRTNLEKLLSANTQNDEPLELVQCKCNIVAVRYLGKTVTQIKGKRKVRVFFNSKHLQQDTYSKMFVENVKYTHDSYVKLNTQEDLQLVLQAVEQVKQSIKIRNNTI